MKIVIIGNGFDLASGLPTTYTAFFDYRVEQRKNEFDSISKLLYFSVKSNAKRYYDEFRRNEAIENNIRITGVKLRKRLENAINQDFVDASITYNKQIKSLIDGGINFWDIYFWVIKNELTDASWSSIEDNIRSFLNDKDIKRRVNVGHYPSKVKLENFKPDVGGTISEQYFEDIMSGANENQKIRILFQSFVNNHQVNYDNNSFYNFLYEQLEKFENEFKEYIKKTIDDFVNSSRTNLKIYRDNFVKLIDNDIDDVYFLINFNYTGFSISTDDKIEPSNSKKFIRNKQEITISEINVHGRCDKKVIFGIDQSEIDATSSAYIFTKTYRKMYESDEMPSLALPKKMEVDEIIFYGHSLSKADYSYFQSIFDFYDIYSSNVKLSFLYSLHGEPHSYKLIKAEKLRSITSLMQTYGHSMSNEDHGKNLVHKLLLENRLDVKEIELKKVSKRMSKNEVKT